ncbi:MAG: hypothetical protein A2539_00070 [Elusimicrobia bacterium RIFOXYD2_FULL_34_15]|nr:MAG: hypothetical protein A2539_00070 [Elusimicrobia bacterium RIFOXYD2_FULL_34_15]
MNKQKFYKISKYDFAVAMFILLFSFSLMSFKNLNSDNKKAFIYKNNKLVEKTSLSQKKVINIKKMKIEVAEGHLRVLESDCPNKICKHSGWISNPYQTIVCVPNKILIEIISDSKDIECNAVSY